MSKILKKIKLVLAISLLFVLGGCKGSYGTSGKLNLVNTNSPIDLNEINATYYKHINYSSDEDTTFDIFLPKTQNKTPLVIFIHGGGFVRGDKSKVYKGDYPQQIRTFLENNIAFATINYRFITNPASNGVITSLSDSKMCLQFIRYHANEFNIDKEKIGMYGGSAGAGTSLWLGLHDDMKDISNNNPVLRESTRLKAVGAIETQATYDLYKWWSVVFKPFHFSMEQMANAGMLQTIQKFYNVDDLDELDSEEMKMYRENIDFLTLMSRDDPPIFVKNEKYSIGIPQSKKEINHHAFHAKILKEQADKIGLEGVFYIPKLDIIDSSGNDVVEFLIKNVK